MEVLGWIIWIVLFVINLGLLYAIVERHKAGRNLALPTKVFLLSLWLVLIYFLLNPQINKLYILIALPVVVIVCSLIAYSIGFFFGFFRKPS